MDQPVPAALAGDATAQARLVRRGELSPRELAEAAMARIEAVNPGLNAVIRTRYDRALAEAAAVDPGAPFAGVPILVKDLDGMLDGEPITGGMAGAKRRGTVARDTATQVADLQRAGFVVLGWTNTPELGAMPTTEPLAFGPTRNPHAPGFSAGGSTGGGAAAVASGMVAVAQGGDAAGSLRIPASACGVFALKPSRGRVSQGPHAVERTAGYGTRLGLTRSVRDMAALLRICAGYRTGDPYVAPELPAGDLLAPPPPLRIGMMTTAPASLCDTDPECRAAAEAAGHLLEALGHRVEVAHSAVLERRDWMVHRSAIRSVGQLDQLRTWSRRFGEPVTEADVEPMTWATAEEGRAMAAVDYLAALAALGALSREALAWWEGFDLLLTPTMAALPPRIGALDSAPDDLFAGRRRAGPLVAYTLLFNITGQPAVSVPFATSASGLPIGIQLVAGYGREDLLLGVSAQIEAARPWVMLAERR